MGHFGGRPREGVRAGADNRKYIKEMSRGRVQLAAREEQRKNDLLQRFDRLTNQINECREPYRREELSKELANFLASGIEGIITVNLMAPFIRESELQDPEKIYSITNGIYGSRRGRAVFALHHVAKLLSASVQEGDSDSYLYIFHNRDGFIFHEDQTERNLQCLKNLIVKSLGVLPVGKSISMKINDRSFCIENTRPDCHGYVNEEELERIQKIMRKNSICPAQSYELRKINSLDNRVYSKLILTTTKPLSCKSSSGESTKEAITYIKFK